tara:strand:+ start:2769 stop:3221 length:453 start_codon:yes stop_codon:yes gene_type:complete
MFSIKIDKNIYKGIDLISIDFLIPHEEVLLNKKEILKNNLKYKDQSVIISSIIVCHESLVIIDGHHRFTALKELGFKKIPVTLINYSNKHIRTTDNNSILKEDLIRNAKKNKLYSPKSTKHSVFCNENKLWSPITLLSTLFELRINSINN